MSSDIRTCLKNIGLVDLGLLQNNSSLDEEFQHVKKAYFKKARETHPDKGGTDAEFRLVNDSFEVLREKYDQGRFKSFCDIMKESTEKEYRKASSQNYAHRSWQFFEEMKQAGIPMYNVEMAKSGRSKCTQKTKIAQKCGEVIPATAAGERVVAAAGQPGSFGVIAKGELRMGIFDGFSGQYGQFVHLRCWRVPAAIWLGLPQDTRCMDHKAFDNELVRMSDVTLAGYTKLTYEERLPIIEFVMNRQNWAKLTVRKLKASAKVNDSNQPLKIAPPLTNGAAGPSFSGPPASSHSSSALVRSNATTGSIPSNELIIVKPRFELPLVRNENRGILAGKTIVLTGTFPEVGGGFGLNLGKDKTRAMIEKFGGRVTSAVSGKTDLLITGTNPGFSKVKKARSQPRCKLLDLPTMALALENADMEMLENPPPLILDAKDFSTGYRGLATTFLEASREEMEVAIGIKAPRLEIKAPRGMKRKGELIKKSSARRPAPKRAKKAPAQEEPSSSSSESEDEEDEELVGKKENVKLKAAPAKKTVPVAPTRRSTRSTRSKQPAMSSLSSSGSGSFSDDDEE